MDPNIADPWLPPVTVVPKDKEGYVQSFNLQQTTEIKKFFDTYGFVVVDEVLTPQECKDTIEDIWKFISSWIDVDRNDPRTWIESKWRTTGIYKEGLIGGSSLWSQTLFQNRQNPNLHKAFSAVFGREDLLVNHDRYGFFRPTKNVKLPDGTTESFPERKTKKNLHLDMNPWGFVEGKSLTETNSILNSLRYKSSSDWIIENNQPGIADPKFFQLNVQAALNLADNKEEDGGFQLVPGFHHHLAQWAHSRPHLRKRFGTESTFIMLPDTDPIHKKAVRITARAGSLICWDQRTTHGSAPNNSDRPRYAQFFKMFPATIGEDRAKARSSALEKKLEENDFKNKLTPLGSKLFGLSPYS